MQAVNIAKPTTSCSTSAPDYIRSITGTQRNDLVLNQTYFSIEFSFKESKNGCQDFE